MALTSSRNCGLFPPGGPSSCGAVTSDMYNGARRARRIAVRSSKLLMASPIIACRMKTVVTCLAILGGGRGFNDDVDFSKFRLR
jgi:hypothetical protein